MLYRYCQWCHLFLIVTEWVCKACKYSSSVSSQCVDNFSVSPSQRLCRLVCAWQPFLCIARTQVCVHIKDSTSICCKKVSLTASGMETRKYCTQEKKKLGRAVLWLLTFPGETSLNFLCIAVALAVMVMHSVSVKGSCEAIFLFVLFLQPPVLSNGAGTVVA